MSIPLPESSWGTVYYRGKELGVLKGAHLPKELWERYMEDRKKEDGIVWHSAPWTRLVIEWEVEDGKLYLRKVYRDGWLEEKTGQKRILADWINEFPIRWKHRRLDKKTEGATDELESLILTLDKGRIVGERWERSRYISRRLRNFIEDDE